MLACISCCAWPLTHIGAVLALNLVRTLHLQKDCAPEDVNGHERSLSRGQAVLYNRTSLLLLLSILGVKWRHARPIVDSVLVELSVLPNSEAGTPIEAARNDGGWPRNAQAVLCEAEHQSMAQCHSAARAPDGDRPDGGSMLRIGWYDPIVTCFRLCAH